MHKYVDKTSLIVIFDFFQQISHNSWSQSIIHKLLFGFAKPYFLLVIFQNGKTEYIYFNVISIFAEPFLSIAKSNLTHPISKLSTSNWNIVKINTKVFIIILISVGVP